jgi:hypothetical protein
MAPGSDAKKRAAKASGPKVPKTDRTGFPKPEKPAGSKTDKTGVPKTDRTGLPRADKLIPVEKTVRISAPPRMPPKAGASKTDVLPTAKAEKLAGALPFLPPAVKPPETPDRPKTEAFEIPSAAFFVDTRPALEQAGPLPPPPTAPDATPPEFPKVTDRVAGPDTKRYRKRVKEGTDRMSKQVRRAWSDEELPAAQDPPPPPPEGGHG